MRTRLQLNAGNALVGAFSLSAVIACLGNIAASIAALLAALIIYAIYPVPFSALRNTLAACNLFLLLLWLTTPWLTQGESLWDWGIFNITCQGFLLCCLVTLKANAIMLIFLSVISPIPVTSLANALARMGLPDKLIWLILLMSANIHFFTRQWTRLREAASLRAFQPRANIESYKVIASFLAILLINAYRRAETTREAMLLRSFCGYLPLLEPWRVNKDDILFCSLCAIFGIGLVLLDYGVVHA